MAEVFMGVRAKQGCQWGAGYVRGVQVGLLCGRGTELWAGIGVFDRGGTFQWVGKGFKEAYDKGAVFVINMVE